MQHISEQLIAEAHDIMARAFVAIRGATHISSGRARELDQRTSQGVMLLADALHDIPMWIHPDTSQRMKSTEEQIRGELDRARKILDRT